MYLLEIEDTDLQESVNASRQFKEVYRGREMNYAFETYSYGTKIKARVKCANIAGASEPSEIVDLETNKGLF